jgi:5-methylcytosine-specific restriction enzyme A
MEIKKGEEYKRKELHNHYSVQRQGGISTPQNHPIIFIFANKRGKDYGYVDGWDEDGYFFYTGEGQYEPDLYGW